MSTPPRTRGATLARASRSYVAREMILPAQEFIHAERASGLVLLAAAVIGLLWANSPWRGAYDALWHTEIGFTAGSFSSTHDLRHWVNDALMVIFFFVVGLEVKREFADGELSKPVRAALPMVGALGGMLVPAGLYLAFNPRGEAAHGWGIPMATDIAFALGVLGLAGPKVPFSARIFLLALAAVDDIGAILVIAVFYTSQLSLAALGGAALILVVILGMRRAGFLSELAYLPLGVLFWFAMLESGVHATIAGVILGLLAPARPAYGESHFEASMQPLLDSFRETQVDGDTERGEAIIGQMSELVESTEAPVNRLLRFLHPWSSYVVLPVFALANTGVSLSGGEMQQALSSPVFLGVLVGLLVGKPVGITAFCWIAVRLGLAERLKGVSWVQLAAIGALAGIGFTVSLFITSLAFGEQPAGHAARTGILAASLAAGVLGYFALRMASGGSETRDRG
ncbi:MAG: Na+/H+ antiporter NhaA [Vicinamibacterales bacterium]